MGSTLIYCDTNEMEKSNFLSCKFYPNSKSQLNTLDFRMPKKLSFQFIVKTKGKLSKA